MENYPKILPNPDNSVRIEDDFEPETHVVYADNTDGGVTQIFGFTSRIPDNVALEDALGV